MDMLIFFYVASILLLTQAHVLEECPDFNGSEELKQYIRFNELVLGITDQGYSQYDVLSRVAVELLDNPRWRDPDLEYHHVIHNNMIKTADSFVLKLLIQETQSGVPTWGGSSFRTELSGDNSRVMCPYRDYFNGTYLICCDVVEQVSVVKLIHEHFNFSAYEAYFELGENATRKVDHVIFQEDVHAPAVFFPLRENYDDCWTVDMDTQMGYWLNMNGDWSWVVEGCRFNNMSRDDVSSCIHDTYNSSIMYSGDSHIRNFFYYTMKQLNPALTVHILNDIAEKHDLNWQPYVYKWNTVLSTMNAFLVDFMERAVLYESSSLLVINTGVWQLLTRPLVDYMAGMEKIVQHLRVLSNMGIKIVWQQLPAIPSNAYAFRWDISNHVIAALNHHTCNRLRDVVGVTCSVNFMTSLAWSEELLCPGRTHTMCFQENFNVLPPGRVASQMILKNICRPDTGINLSIETIHL